MRVLTRTFPPSTNPNYGGILQSWALQQALSDLGHESLVDSTRSSYRSATSEALHNVGGALISMLASAGATVPRERTAIYRTVNAEILSFPRRNIHQARLYKRPGAVRRRHLREYDAFITGSDQVWRPRYVDVPSYLFDFLDATDTRPRIAYAASFGVGDASEYDPRLVAETASLAERLTAVSVRESSGIDIAEELWSIRAVRCPDPTFLLPVDRYEALAGVPAAHEPKAPVVSYLLDGTDEKSAIVQRLAERLAAPVCDLMRPPPRSYRELRADPIRFVRPSVEEWLRALSSAAYVVTDSFHGAVFAILFNRPFRILPNAKRGLARFESLLETFGLEETMGEVSHDRGRIPEPDWTKVNAIIDRERAAGLGFLTAALQPDSSSSHGPDLTAQGPQYVL